MTLASYNNFHNNVFKDAFVITLTNAGRSTAVLSSWWKIFIFLNTHCGITKIISFSPLSPPNFSQAPVFLQDLPYFQSWATWLISTRCLLERW